MSDYTWPDSTVIHVEYDVMDVYQLVLMKSLVVLYTYIKCYLSPPEIN